MDTVAIDVGTECVGLCKWDGQQLSVHQQPTQPPLDAWPTWIKTLCPASNYQVLYHCTHSEYAATSRAGDIAACAKRQGARWIRLFSEDIESDPSIAAARYEAIRHHLGSVCSVEVGAGHATLAVLGARGSLLLYDRISLHKAESHASAQLCRALNSLISSARDQSDSDGLTELPLLVGGGRGSIMAVQLAERCGASHVLIPDHSACWATVGMYLADIVLAFREDRPRSPLCLPELRHAFGRLMDKACTAITMEGYDLDDVISERTVELSYMGESRWVEVPCTGLADESSILNAFRAQHAASYGPCDSTRPVDVRSVGVRAVIETKKPQFPLSTRPADHLEDALIRKRHSNGTIPTNDPHYTIDKIPVGVEINGPAQFWKADTSMMISANWAAQRSPVGGIWISRKDQQSTSG